MKDKHVRSKQPTYVSPVSQLFIVKMTAGKCHVWLSSGFFKFVSSLFVLPVQLQKFIQWLEEAEEESSEGEQN